MGVLLSVALRKYVSFSNHFLPSLPSNSRFPAVTSHAVVGIVCCPRDRNHPSNHMLSKSHSTILACYILPKSCIIPSIRNLFVKTIRTPTLSLNRRSDLGVRTHILCIESPLYRPRTFGRSTTHSTRLTHSLKSHCVSCTLFRRNPSEPSSRPGTRR